MAKCRACGKFLSALGGATCKCSAVYHKACVSISEDAQTPINWICPECKCKIPKSGNAATPVKGLTAGCNVPSQLEVSRSTTDNIANFDSVRSISPGIENQTTQLLGVELGTEIRLFRDELREVRQEFRSLRQEIFELRNLFTSSNDRINELEVRINAIECLKETDCTSKISTLEKAIAQFKLDINDRDQALLQSDLEVSNLPEVAKENTTQTIIVLAAKLGLTLRQEDVVFAERVGNMLEGETKRCRRLVVRLSRRQLRDDFLKSARVRRGATSADMGMGVPPQRFYVNERLTSTNRKLFYSTREAAKDALWKYTWTKRGHIYARQAEGKTVNIIRSHDDLTRVFGSNAVRNTSEHRV